MKKFTLPIILLFIFFPPFNIFAQEPLTKEITCKDFKKLLNTANCPFWARKQSTLWCYKEEFNGGPDDVQGYIDAIMSRPPSYILDSDSCLEGSDNQEADAQPDKSQSGQTGSKQNKPLDDFKSSVQDLNSWIIETFGIYEPKMSIVNDRNSEEIEKAVKENESRKLDSKLNDEALWQSGIDPKDLLERKPRLAEIDIEQLKQQQGQPDSQFRVDILKGQVQIKLPGSDEWSDLKQGDKIPPGSTIFTGMDTTTVLSIRDKGVIQVLSFTEVTITEESLADPTKTTTEIDLRAGEVELNVPRGVFTGSLQVTTPTAHNAVRGTHFWASYDKDKKLSTTGVYKGQVEVQALGSNKSTFISPNGDKPGVVVVTQKLSIIKLAVAGLIAVGVVGGAVFLFKKIIRARGDRNNLKSRRRN